MTTAAAHPGLTFATFRRRDPGDVSPERLDGWLDAHARGFHQGRVGDDLRRHFAAHMDADDVLMRGVWQDRPALGSGAIPVATYSSFDKTLNVGDGRLLPLRMITDVTVSPTHRRQGLLRSLITADLQDAVDLGLPMAALTASEGSIYGRFGFGPATYQRHVEVETTGRFALRAFDDDGGIELLEPVEAWPAVSSSFAAFHERTRGSAARPQFYEPTLTGVFDFKDGPDKLLRTAVHVGADGAPDGYVVYKVERQPDGVRTVAVQDLVALTPAAYLRIWRFLADIDLTDTVSWPGAPVTDPLPWALVEPRAVGVVKVTDLLWVRVLDVVAALEARPWGADGEVVVEVTDPLHHAAGRFRVVVSAGRASAARTSDEPEVLLDAESLGALYLSGVSVATLRGAGRLGGTDRGLRTWAAMADTGPAPYCITGF